MVREIPVGEVAVQWHLAAASVQLPPADFVHSGGSLHFYFRLRDANGDPVARGNTSFSFVLTRRLLNVVTEGTPVVSAQPNQQYDEDNAPAGGYLIVVVDKANFPPEATHLQVFAQSN